MSDRSINAVLFQRAQRVIPGGVNSPVRAFRAVDGVPRFIARGEGATLIDEEGRRYTDYVSSWGASIFGHADAEVREAIVAAVADGSTFGAPTRREVDLAEWIVSAYPGIEQVRLVSSGTEAVMSAVRLARGATGRDLIVKFSGCYHGHGDSLLVEAGSGLATFGEPSSAGVPQALAALTRVVALDDSAAIETVFEREGAQIAAVVIEPVPANSGLLPQRPEFLAQLRRLATRHGALLLFDEVISGFRLGRGGAAAWSGVTPDLVTFGKVIGGGLPAAAFGGPRSVMRHLAPEGPVYQAGTLSGNPAAVAAGLATLRKLQRIDGWRTLEDIGAAFEQAVAPVLRRAPLPIRLVRVGSLFWFWLGDGEPPRSAEGWPPNLASIYTRLFHALLRDGIYLPPSAFEVGFLTLAHRPQDFAAFAEALENALQKALV